MNSVHMILTSPKLDRKTKIFVSARADTPDHAREDAFEVLKICSAYGLTLEYMTET